MPGCGVWQCGQEGGPVRDAGVGANRMTAAEPPRVLLVDDHHLLVDALQVVLERHGIGHVMTAPNLTSEGILTAASEFEPDVVVLDLDLGVHGSSLPLVRPLTELGAAVVAVAEEVDPVGLASAMEVGAAGVMSKSEGPDRLVAI